MSLLVANNLSKFGSNTKFYYENHSKYLTPSKDKTMTAIISKASFDFEVVEDSRVNYLKISKALFEIGHLYPNFKNWLYFTFRPGVIIGDRKILIAHCDGNLSAISLLKNTQEEKKICTFYVLPDYRFKGLSSTLMDKSLSELSGGEISITVSEERNCDLERILLANEFTLSEEHTGIYRHNKTEFFYKR